MALGLHGCLNELLQKIAWVWQREWFITQEIEARVLATEYIVQFQFRRNYSAWFSSNGRLKNKTSLLCDVCSVSERLCCLSAVKIFLIYALNRIPRSRILDHRLDTFMDSSEGVKFGSDPLLDRVEQLHAANPLQLLRNPVPETYTHIHKFIFWD